jgi:hypothetical protein
MIGIPKGFKKVGVRKATADITDCKGMILSKGQRFFVLELKKMKRPKGFSIIIAVDNGFEDDNRYPVTGISEEDFANLTEESE